VADHKESSYTHAVKQGVNAREFDIQQSLRRNPEKFMVYIDTQVDV